tara:strand:- start:373 stop:588 length:216 start_codon:yes stop_codon:yes gene_type:complete
MKTKNIPPDIKSKSINDAKLEILDILDRLEKENVDLQASRNDYQRLLKLNNYVDDLFKEKIKKIRFIGKKK